MLSNSFSLFSDWSGPALARPDTAPSHPPNAQRGNRLGAIGLVLTTVLLAAPVGAQSTGTAESAGVTTQTGASVFAVNYESASSLDGFLTQTREHCGHTHQAERFIQALSVELAAAAFTPPDEAVTSVITCDADAGTLTLRLSNRELSLDVSDVPRPARARTLAVAFAETLRLPPEAISGPVQDAAPAPHESPSPAAPSRPTVGEVFAATNPTPSAPSDVSPTPSSAQRGSPTSGLALPISAGATVIGPEQTLAFGARIGASLAVAAVFRLSAHLGYLTAHHASALGQARLHAASLEAVGEATVWRPSPDSTFDLGASVGLYRAHVVVSSAWGIDEPNKDAWFGLWGVHAGISTLLHDRLRVFTQLGGIKDVVGLRLRAGGQRAMSFYGFGAQLRLGAAYDW